MQTKHVQSVQKRTKERARREAQPLPRGMRKWVETVQGRPADASKTMTAQGKPPHATTSGDYQSYPRRRAECMYDPGLLDVPQGGAAEGAQGGRMRGSGGMPGWKKQKGGMPSRRCSEDEGQPCRGATQPKLARVQRQHATRPTSPRPNKQKP